MAPKSDQKPTFINRKRLKKAKMIEAVLVDYLGGPIENVDLMDIGGGNGEIADYFQQHNRVASVDISDRRVNKDTGVDFRVVDSEALPFEDRSFDIVISNHVLEHVPDQSLHLDEIRRVLRPDGCCYLATPNRSSPFMEEHEGNELVFHYRNMKPFFDVHHFNAIEYGAKCAKEPVKYHVEGRTPHFLPMFALQLIRPIFPSHIFILTPKQD